MGKVVEKIKLINTFEPEKRLKLRRSPEMPMVEILMATSPNSGHMPCLNKS